MKSLYIKEVFYMNIKTIICIMSVFVILCSGIIYAQGDSDFQYNSISDTQSRERVYETTDNSGVNTREQSENTYMTGAGENQNNPEGTNSGTQKKSRIRTFYEGAKSRMSQAYHGFTYRIKNMFRRN
ncbi:MAG: hypothetical protein KAI55_00235 [Candidatus Aenigmarchaeota archaeon]|nr:hypothetical protein [Candidatus Aenigmarchaeota archaeon]